VRQYQVNVDPNKLLGYKIPINMVADAIRRATTMSARGWSRFTGREYMVRGRGYIKSLDDIGKIVIMSTADGTPVLVATWPP
jgi:Cu(I)/Ag(I) efflux system membrane protein CusA/SilA